MNIRSIAQALGGDVAGRDSVLAPGPGHSPATARCRSPSRVTISSSILRGRPLGICRDDVKARLGLAEWRPGTARPRTAAAILTPDFDDHAARQLAKGKGCSGSDRSRSTGRSLRPICAISAAMTARFHQH